MRRAVAPLPDRPDAGEPIAPEEFDRLIAPLGPFERRPSLAVAVSGGADSLALCLLADHWARGRGGRVLGLIVDHGLRDESAAEAEQARQQLERRGIAARVLTVQNLARGPGLAARARAARYAALSEACATAGILHLLLGHHAADQAETAAMRALAGSGPDGLAAMPALAETRDVRLLRPLLTVPPGRLRATLRNAGEGWVEDPSNANAEAQRARLRAARCDRDGIGPVTTAAVAATIARGRQRAWRERETAAVMARRARIAPEGFAVLSPGAIGPAALGALLRTLAGADWPPAPGRVALLARRPRPATLGGVRLLPAGGFCPGGWLVVREPAAIAPATQVLPHVAWDGRFNLGWVGEPPPDAQISAIGGAAAGFRRVSELPGAVLRTLPCLRVRGKLVATPLVGYRHDSGFGPVWFVFVPPVPVAPAPFRAA